MNEFTVILKARQFVRDAGIDSIPVDVTRYAEAAKATIKISNDLAEDESGQNFPIGDSHIIVVNGNHREERQRFTILHEIAHIVLELPSQNHGPNLSTSDLVSYRRRPHEEILCDVFAAECLLPHSKFRKDVEDVDVSMDEVMKLANRYKASVTSTGSRFALNCRVPCAFILMEDGKIRYASMSQSLRERKGWIDFGTPIPRGSVAEKITRSSSKLKDYDELPVDIWFTNRIGGFEFFAEDSLRLPEWDQCLSLVWFDDELRQVNQGQFGHEDDDEGLLAELDGILPWPSKSKRKK